MDLKKKCIPKAVPVKIAKERYALSGNRCAFPGCQLPLFDQQTGVHIGKICHIKGKSPAGPRYDPKQSDTERNSAANLILLCGNDHDLIDQNPSTYDVATLLKMKADHDFNGAERVFAHSFYSQGSSDQRQVSAEHFINQAFNFLGFDGETPGSPHDQGLLLGKLFSQRKTLLILDGLEPMQYPPGVMESRLKDQSLIALLKNLAFNLNGLCVITSRVAVFELSSSNCPSYPLEQLSTEAGIQAKAQQLFSAAETIQQQRQPEYQQLYSWGGSVLCVIS